MQTESSIEEENLSDENVAENDNEETCHNKKVNDYQDTAKDFSYNG